MLRLSDPHHQREELVEVQAAVPVLVDGVAACVAAVLADGSVTRARPEALFPILRDGRYRRTLHGCFTEQGADECDAFLGTVHGELARRAAPGARAVRPAALTPRAPQSRA